MAEQIILKCIKCGGDIITANEERLVKCRFCGKTFMMPSFIQEKVELSEVEKERDAERAARCEAEERLFTTVGTLNEISDSQREAEARLDALILEAQKSKQRRNEELGRLYEQADGLQRDREFDKAADAYRRMLVMGCEDVEIYWRLVMCHYGVEYQDDGGGRRIPSILKPDLTDPRELSVWRDMNARAKPGEGSYLEDMAQIEAILDRYRAVRGRMDFDVFISVKQTIDGHPTNDSEVGLKLYDCLTRQGLRVFNSKKSALLPVGENYEPYIMAALLSARVMIVVGTCAEHMNAQWVRNEWSRFQWLQKNERDGGRRKLLCYLAGGMQPCDIPRALSPDRQAIVDGIEAEELLLKALDYLMPKVPAMQAQSEAPLAGVTFDGEEQKLRGWLSMGRFDLVTKRYEKLVEQGLFLDQPRLYLYALCAERCVCEIDHLANTEDDLAEMRLFKLANNLCAVKNEELEALLKQNAKCRLVTLAKKGDPQAQYGMGTNYYFGVGGLPKDREKAVEWFRKAATQGYAKGQHALGVMYEKGICIGQDYTEAERWYRLAAEQAYESAQFSLGEMYETREDGKMNIEEAALWYRLAAEQGNAQAQCKLGFLYCASYPFGFSPKDAVKWFRKAAEQGNVDAQYELGKLYDAQSTTWSTFFGFKNSRDVEDLKDYAEAAIWYGMAASQGNASAQIRLAEMYKTGLGVKKNYAEALKWYLKAEHECSYPSIQFTIGEMYEKGMGVNQDYAEAVNWYRKAAFLDVKAQNRLGAMYEYGKGVKQDFSEAIKWYRKAAEQGNAYAQYCLGVMYENGRGLRKDYGEAISWYRKAAEQGNSSAQYSLGMLYVWGKGVRCDYQEAGKWFHKAAKQGNAAARYCIGVMFENGDSVKRDFLEAANWYRLAAEQGNNRAQYRLGLLYEKGHGVKQDREEAVKWYRLAAEQGDADALKKCARLGIQVMPKEK